MNNAKNMTGKFGMCGLVLFIALVSAFAMVFSARVVNAGSIWDNRSRRGAHLFSDQLALKVGDILRVVVIDNSSFNHEGDRSMNKSSNHGASATGTYGGKKLFEALQLSEHSERAFSGHNEYTGSRKFNDTVSVTVVDKLPNGNMVIAGKKERDVEGEEVCTVLTGVIRPEDVSGENAISFKDVAKARLFYETDGTSDGFMRLGWFNQIVNVLWPF